MIGERFNFEDVFFRDLTVCVLHTLEGQVKWINRFSSGDVFVQVPFYYSLTGDERFLLDSFSDDIVSENRFVELNTDYFRRLYIFTVAMTLLRIYSPSAWTTETLIPASNNQHQRFNFKLQFVEQPVVVMP